MNILKSFFYAAGLLFCTACATSAGDIHAWGAKGDYDRIRQELRQTPSEPVKIAAAIELGKGNYSFGISDMVTLSRDTSPAVRQAAIEALGHYAGAEVYNTIIQATGDDNEEVARTAERILFTWQSEAADFLLEALQHRNYKVRVSAVRVLGKISDSRIGQALLLRAQRDEHSTVRREAVKMLGSMGWHPAKKVLYILKNKDTSKEVSLEAEAAIGRIGGTIFPFKMLLVPFAAAENKTLAIAGEAHNSLQAGITALSLCETLLPKEKTGAPASLNELQTYALAQGKETGAEQVLFGIVEKTDNRITITVRRAEVANAAMLQQEKAEGYVDEPEKAIEELVKKVLSRFE